MSSTRSPGLRLRRPASPPSSSSLGVTVQNSESSPGLLSLLLLLGVFSAWFLHAHSRFSPETRLAFVLVAQLGSLVALLFGCSKKLRQDPKYHLFADSRAFCACLPNTNDVVSNLSLAFAGFAGIAVLIRRNAKEEQPWMLESTEYTAWMIFFIGMVFVSIGSAYYHWVKRELR